MEVTWDQWVIVFFDLDWEKLVFRRIKNDKRVTHIGEVGSRSSKDFMALWPSLSVSCAFLCDVFMLREALSMKQKWWPPTDLYWSRPPEEKSSLSKDTSHL